MPRAPRWFIAAIWRWCDGALPRPPPPRNRAGVPPIARCGPGFRAIRRAVAWSGDQFRGDGDTRAVMTILAITGATGFVGGALVDQALAAGHDVRALTRRPQPPREGVTWVGGALDRPDALVALCTGADAVIHVAGVVNAPDRAGFAAGNVDGTRAAIAAAQAAGVRRFIHV